MDNLKTWGVHYISNRKVRPMDAVMFDIDDTLIFTSGRHDYLGFTSAETKHLMKQNLPYNFMLSIGDMPTDLTGSPHYLNISNFDHN
jgi:acid phosphatase class B